MVFPERIDRIATFNVEYQKRRNPIGTPELVLYSTQTRLRACDQAEVRSEARRRRTDELDLGRLLVRHVPPIKSTTNAHRKAFRLATSIC